VLKENFLKDYIGEIGKGYCLEEAWDPKDFFLLIRIDDLYKEVDVLSTGSVGEAIDILINEYKSYTKGYTEGVNLILSRIKVNEWFILEDPEDGNKIRIMILKIPYDLWKKLQELDNNSRK